MRYDQLWANITSPNNALAQKACAAVLQKCVTIINEPADTPNHANRLAKARQFIPENNPAGPIASISNNIGLVMPAILANGDVAYALTQGVEIAAALGDAVIDTALETVFPPAQ
jgi:hypothetical protein